MSIFVQAGQFIIGAVFVAAVVGDILDRNNTMTLLSAKLDMLLNRKLPYTHNLYYGAVGLKLVCGLGLIFNVLAPVAAFFLAGFTIIANIIFNNFWSLQGEARKSAYILFLIHWAIIGGLIALIGA